MTKKAWRTYRCDFMEAIQQLNQTLDFTTEELKESYRHQQTTARTIPFKAIITEKGKEFFINIALTIFSWKKRPRSVFSWTDSSNRNTIFSQLFYGLW